MGLAEIGAVARSAQAVNGERARISFTGMEDVWAWASRRAREKADVGQLQAQVDGRLRRREALGNAALGFVERLNHVPAG